jgi:DNA-directed RNA polymerase specialized sigma24 family protein
VNGNNETVPSQGAAETPDDRILSFLHPDRRQAERELQSLLERFTAILARRGFRDPEDMASEAVYRALKKIQEEKFQGGNLPGYLWRILENLQWEEFKRRAPMQLEPELLPAPEYNPRALHSVEQEIDVRTMLEGLPEKKRRRFLDYLDGKYDNAGEAVKRRIRVEICKIRKLMRAAMRKKANPSRNKQGESAITG